MFILSAYIYTVQIGFEVFVWTRFVLALGALFLHFYLLRMTLGLRIFPLIIYLAGVTCVALFVVTLVNLFVLSQLLGTSGIRLLIGGLLSALSY